MKFSLLINMKMPTIVGIFSAKHDFSAEHEIFSANKYETIVGIFIFISRENFMLSWVEHEKKGFITSGPGFMFFCVKYMLNFDGHVSKVCKKTLNN